MVGPVGTGLLGVLCDLCERSSATPARDPLRPLREILCDLRERSSATSARDRSDLEAFHPAAGKCRSNRAPPVGPFAAETVPPWRSMMARTIERPRPLPDGTAVPAREASTL
jgi:hypothetical protein